MAVIFPRWANKVPLYLAVVGALGGAFLVFAVWYWGSPNYTDVGYAPEQPVPFSHRLHAGELAMDCRYCHNTVERAAYAAIPPTETCMNCHKSIAKESKKLAAVRKSYESGRPIAWVRVHLLPDYTYFNHSVHVAAGVGCVSCHGRIDQMNIVRQAKPLSMSWCLSCHRQPDAQLRPRDEVTNMSYDPKQAGYEPAKDPARKRKVDPPIHCSGCHR
ncbi:MAG: cytochrome c3 family protein [Deltaproteobacteria bacterium]|nr:cytochrome c3 family protein [Deltaproteobacteria bacterium]